MRATRYCTLPSACRTCNARAFPSDAGCRCCKEEAGIDTRRLHMTDLQYMCGPVAGNASKSAAGSGGASRSPCGNCRLSSHMMAQITSVCGQATSSSAISGRRSNSTVWVAR